MTSAPRSARWVVRLPGPSIDTSTMRRPASGAGRSAVTGPQATCRPRAHPAFGASDRVQLVEQAQLIVGRVGHAALDRVGMTVQARVGHRDQRRARERCRQRGARGDVRGDDLQPGHRLQRRVDRPRARSPRLVANEFLDLAAQPGDLDRAWRRARRAGRLRLGQAWSRAASAAGLGSGRTTGTDAGPRATSCDSAWTALRTPLMALSADPAGFLRSAARTSAGRRAGERQELPLFELDWLRARGTQIHKRDPDETEDDAGQGQAVAALAALGVADLGAGHEAEDDGDDRADPARNPAHQAENERRDREPVGRGRLESGRRVRRVWRVRAGARRWRIGAGGRTGGGCERVRRTAGAGPRSAEPRRRGR